MQAFRNARLVLASEVLDGSLLVKEGAIAAIDSGASVRGEDCEGDYLIPGLVELHTDNLENHYRPRPGVFWNALAALQSHDAQVAGAGITTVFDAIRIGSDHDLPDMEAHAEVLVAAIGTARADGRLRAEHFVHLRCEAPSHDVVSHFSRWCALPFTRLASVMDHTPGQRQFRSLEDYKRFYKKSMGHSDAEAARFIADRLAEQARFSAPNRAAIVQLARAHGLVLLSHDDSDAGQVADAVREGVSISEFPTTLEAAQHAHAAGLFVLMGAPNVVRGRSHSGNVSAKTLAEAGLLDILSSDYVPFALCQAAFALPDLVPGATLPQAIALVTRTPAKAAGLLERGEIAEGLRADLVRIKLMDGMPVVRAVWRAGTRVA